MRVLITGMNGFAGSHLSELLLRETYWNLIGASRDTTGSRPSARVQWWKMELTDPDAVFRLLKYERPDVIIHLAGQAHVGLSWQDAWSTFESNVRGTLNLFQGVLKAGLTPRVLVISSNEVYGPPSGDADLPFREDHRLNPANPYGVSKVAQDVMTLQYHTSHGLDALVARPFNHFGPGQMARFVAPQFACQIAEIEQGLRDPVLRVGNMAARRDFTDVRDVARAYLALVQKADPGQAYNICSGQAHSVQEILDVMLSMSSAKITIENDPAKFRTADTPISYGDNAKIKQVTGWQPAYAFEQTIADILNDWRERVKAGERSPE